MVIQAWRDRSLRSLVRTHKPGVEWKLYVYTRVLAQGRRLSSICWGARHVGVWATPNRLRLKNDYDAELLLFASLGAQILLGSMVAESGKRKVSGRDASSFAVF